ncbi:Uncharacterised protein [Mycobacteroides abscessus subsp. abscessus]|nr:Uncharacterised protein [Mycobacteroides abscessus subsp. abscessus]
MPYRLGVGLVNCCQPCAPNAASNAIPRHTWAISAIRLARGRVNSCVVAAAGTARSVKNAVNNRRA